MPLTDTQIRNAKPADKPIRLFDGGGLYLEIASKGGKWWRLKYRYVGKEKRISLGVYPDVSLKLARERRDDARKLLASDIDPSMHRKIHKVLKMEKAANTLEVVSDEWLTKQAAMWTPGHQKRIRERLEANVYPWLGSRPVAEITAPELLVALRRMEDRGAVDMAHRVRQICGSIFRYAIATGRADRDVAADLRGALRPTVKKHLPSITDPKLIGQLLRDIDAAEGYFVTRQALKLAPLVFVRPGELRHAEWSEIDFDVAEWRIPASKMKMKAPHIVPLSIQALSILSEIKPLTGNGKYVFPSVRTRKRPMSENTINVALRRIGYDKQTMTGHGFRSMASTLLNEQGFNRDWIERQLAHSERDESRAAYNYAEHVTERRNMMQSWADYLDGIKHGAEVVNIGLR